MRQYSEREAGDARVSTARLRTQARRGCCAAQALLLLRQEPTSNSRTAPLPQPVHTRASSWCAPNASVSPCAKCTSAAAPLALAMADRRPAMRLPRSGRRVSAGADCAAHRHDGRQRKGPERAAAAGALLELAAAGDMISVAVCVQRIHELDSELGDHRHVAVDLRVCGARSGRRNGQQLEAVPRRSER